MTPHEQTLEKIELLTKVMVEDTPQLPTVLSQIKILLQKNPEVVTLLSEEDIGKLVAGMSVRSNEKLKEATVKATRAKSTKNLSLDDL